MIHPFLAGTYTERLAHVAGRGPGVVTGRLDSETGRMSLDEQVVPVRNPAYLCAHPRLSLVYSTSEIHDFGGGRDGCLTALEWDRKTRNLKISGQTSSAGRGPAWVAADRSGGWLMAANYLEGNLAVFPIHDDGTLGPPACTVRHHGSGPDLFRQEAPHPHAVLASPDNRHVYAADLGTDAIHGYRFDAGCGSLTADSASCLRFPPGSGPRHLAFHPDGCHLFVVLELSSELAVLEYSAETGGLREIERKSTLPDKTSPQNHPSELAIHRNGRFIHVANRGHDSIATFAIDTSSGNINRIGNAACDGHIPRHIALSPDNRWLLVANQESSTITSMACDPETGALSPPAYFLPIETPCFVLFP